MKDTFKPRNIGSFAIVKVLPEVRISVKDAENI